MAKSKRRPAPRPASQKESVEQRAARAAERERRVAERETARRQAVARARRRRWLRTGAVVTVVALAAGGLAFRYLDRRNEVSELVASSAAAARTAGCAAIRQPGHAGRDHLAAGRAGRGYSSKPATSGPHLTSTAGTGVTETPVEDGRLIHNLEHGGVVVHHRDLPAEQLAALTERIRDLDDAKVLLVPNPDLPGGPGVAYTAWRRLQTCERYDADVLDTFLDLYLAPGGKDVGAPEKDQRL